MKKLIGLVVFVFVAVVAMPTVAWADDSQVAAIETVNINTADVASLTQLDGIGESKAQAIIAWRDENGSFETVDQLLAVNGIGDATLEAIRTQIALE
ncbi:helix-hairpin-helix domain-containing protein [Gilvimarinus sp. SDUM040013]|uniref:Helix-hairpin-helix domain-containing protein n=1 Tax=Gilvimarinus gilvus TaxID=3058038 RepID=A0ABU4RU31_9GAMM|nr:helix-hairpin-helix domain-containing protein [Gilvimarinus sp. SDUM040013]MDO3385022.1 helix-hairpin-helix domain-containing protein [Gilvimarinus sp. SDUM040013]MDX6848397.1 helix-hairpin-helix domain-containing protein [Gilvimarinus sp. SDUM040013]